MRNLAIRLARRADNWLGMRYIGVRHFGFEEVGRDPIAPCFGGGSFPVWKKHWHDSECEPFYRHNRELHALRFCLRNFALRLERGK